MLGVAQWQSTCLVCARPWVQLSAPQVAVRGSMLTASISVVQSIRDESDKNRAQVSTVQTAH